MRSLLIQNCKINRCRYLSDINDYLQCNVGAKEVRALHFTEALPKKALPCNATQCNQCNAMQCKVGTWSEARELKGCPLQQKRFGIQSPDAQRRQTWQIETSAYLYSSFLLHIMERRLTIDGWTVCRNLADQLWPILLILLIRSYSYCWSCWSDLAHIAKRWVAVFCQQVRYADRWFFWGFSYPNNVHPWHLWPLCWNPFNNVPATWKGIILAMLFQMLPTSI